MNSENYQEEFLLYYPKANFLIILLCILLYDGIPALYSNKLYLFRGESKITLDVFSQIYPIIYLIFLKAPSVISREVTLHFNTI
jgi:hypothetical protein